MVVMLLDTLELPRLRLSKDLDELRTLASWLVDTLSWLFLLGVNFTDSNLALPAPGLKFRNAASAL